MFAARRQLRREDVLRATNLNQWLGIRVTTEHRLEVHASRSGILVATRRDAEGRILAPVKINGQGPFEFIVNTSAGRTVLSQTLALRLRLSVDPETSLLVHGVTGSTRVPMVRIDSMTLGHLNASATTLPVVANLFDSACGLLSLTDFAVQRVLLNIQRNEIMLPQALALPGIYPGSSLLGMDPTHVQIVVVDTRVQGKRVKAVIDTAADATLGNLALRRVLFHQALNSDERVELVGATAPGHIWKPQPLPVMELGSLRIVGARIAYGNLPLFERLDWTSTPAMLIGMDILGQFESVLLNYENRTIRFQPRTARQP